jgi:hypothetical protein
MLINQTMAERDFEHEDPIGQYTLVQEIQGGSSSATRSRERSSA